MKSADVAAADIREILSSVAEIEVESDDQDILATGRLDSLSLVEIIFTIEERFGVAIALDELDLQAFSSVRSIVALLGAAVAGKRPTAGRADPRADGASLR